MYLLSQGLASSYGMGNNNISQKIMGCDYMIMA